MASIIEIVEQWKKALKIEIKHLKEQGGARYTISDGKCLKKTEKGATYWFLLASDIFLPDDAPIRVEYKNQAFYGKVISVEGFDVVLELDSYFGDEIEEAYLFSEPWELLESLCKRLETVQNSELKRNRLKRLLRPNYEAKHPKENIKGPIHEVFLRSKFNPATFIWGPPGTGKTYTLARVVAHHYIRGKKILVMTHSNAAVDVLMLELAEYMMEKNKWRSGDILRYGFSADPKIREYDDLLAARLVETSYPELETKIKKLEKERERLKKILQLSTSEVDSEKLANVEEQLKTLRTEIKDREAEFVNQASVIGVTLSKAALDPLIYEQQFDVVVVDEASMAYVPQIAFASSLGKRLIVCGDFMQLPPIAMAEHPLVNKWLKTDIFHAAKIVDVIRSGKNHPHLFMLKEQRRMHPDISSFTNEFIYDKKVYDSPTVREKRQPITNKGPFPKEAAVLIDLSRMGAYCLKEEASDSRFNLYSALLSMQLILAGKHNEIQSIGFITPYKAQARLLSACIQDLIPHTANESGERKVIAATVHKFQGSERDMIIFDTVDSFPQQRPSVLLTDDDSKRLINVAVTRARGKFIQIIDRKYMDSRLSKKQAARALTEHLFLNNEFYTRYELPSISQHSFHEKLKWFNDDLPEHLFRDIQNAKQNIIISAPIPSQMDRKLWHALQSAEKKARITFITQKKAGIPLSSFDYLPKNLVMPFIIIDQEILWVGTPLTIDTQYESHPQPPYMTARLVSKRVIKLLHSFLNLQTAKYSHEEVQEKVVSYRPSYTLKQYITSWDQCPTCKSIRKIELTPTGSIKLICGYCGNTSGLSRKLLQKYLDHVNLKCRTCNRMLEVTGNGRNLGVECERCKQKIDVKSLW
jgi:hypothetical protein